MVMPQTKLHNHSFAHVRCNCCRHYHTRTCLIQWTLLYTCVSTPSILSYHNNTCIIIMFTGLDMSVYSPDFYNGYSWNWKGKKTITLNSTSCGNDHQLTWCMNTVTVTRTLLALWCFVLHRCTSQGSTVSKFSREKNTFNRERDLEWGSIVMYS